MDTLQKILDQQLKTYPRIALQKVIEKKLISVGLHSDPSLVDQIINKVLTNDSSVIQWDDGKDTNSSITLSISENDIAEIEKMFGRLMESIPNLIETTSTKIAKSLLKSLKKKWLEESLYQKQEWRIFRSNLGKRWGKALGLLRILLTISRELGGEIAITRSSDDSHLNNVSIRLHIRACQLTAEIITLLENGYADGAMARWRTLHEISIVMALMHDHGEPLAERYVDHRAVEAKSGKDQYLVCYEQLGYEALNESDCYEIDEEYVRIIEKYGKEFGGPYGWAEGYVTKNGRGRLGLGDLEVAAGRSAMASHYKLASHNVHAGPHALFFRLGLIDGPMLLAGASNAGLSEPGQNTAVTFCFISILLVRDCANFDIIVMMKILQLLRDEIPRAFAKAELKLQADHERHTQNSK